MKKIPKFWKIYIFTVTVIVLLSCVFLVFLSGYLRNYESKAQKEAENRRLSETVHESELRDEAERQSGYEITKRQKLISAVKNAADMASVYVSNSVVSSPASVMDALIASLNETGASVVSGYIKCDTGKYEDPGSVSKYIDSISGTYSYEAVSKLEYSLQKGDLEAKVTLSEGQNGENGNKTYSVAAIDVSLPLSSYRIFTPQGAVLTVNGVTVTDEPTYEEQSLPDVIPSSFTIPSSASYELGGFIYRPKLQAFIGDTECPALDYENKTVFVNPSNDKYKTELFDRICELSYAYSDFVAGAFKFNEMAKYLYPGTKLYKNLSGFDNRWYYEFHHIVNENPKITDFNVISDNLISAHIEFNQSLRSEKDRTYNDINITFNVYVGCDKVPQGSDKSAWLLVHVE